MKKLSICIPTFNRVKMLQELLDSILSQVTKTNQRFLEIVISDNASDDGTKELVEQYSQKFPIIYIRNEKNFGADRNYIQVVDASTGEYAWIIGSDDAIPSGALDRVFTEIEAGYDIYLSDRIEGDFYLKNQKVRNLFKKPVKKEVLILENTEDFITFCEASDTLGGVLSYLSSVVFSKKKWNRVKFDETYYGTLYAYLYKWYSFIKLGCSLKYIMEPIAICRLDNDGFKEGNYVLRRLNFDFVMYKRIVDNCIINNNAKYHLLKVMTREHEFSKFFEYIKNSDKTKQDIETFLKYIKYYPYSKEQQRAFADLFKKDCPDPV